MKKFKKKDFPVEKVRRFLEPGPVVLVSSAYKGERDIMTMGWHMVMMDEPSLVGCFIWDQNYSRELVRRSKECVINVPTVDIAETVVGIGNYHGPKPDKFEKFGLTAEQGTKVSAPLIAECLCELRMQARGCKPHQKVQPIRVRGGEGARSDKSEVSHDDALSRRGAVHDCGARQQVSGGKGFKPEML